MSPFIQNSKTGKPSWRWGGIKAAPTLTCGKEGNRKKRKTQCTFQGV